jgi:hypothetical protein
MASFYSLPQDIINNIFKMVPIYAFSKCKDMQGYYFPIIDQFIKDVYISEEAVIDDKKFLQLDYLSRKTIYESSIEDMIKKLTLSYAQDYIKYVDDYGDNMKYSKCIKGTPTSLIVFRIKTSQPHESHVVLFEDYCEWYENDDYFSGRNHLVHIYKVQPQHEVDCVKTMLFYVLSQTICRSRLHKKEWIRYESIEIVKFVFPHGFVKDTLFDEFYNLHEETVLMKYHKVPNLRSP